MQTHVVIVLDSTDHTFRNVDYSGRNKECSKCLLKIHVLPDGKTARVLDAQPDKVYTKCNYTAEPTINMIK